VNPLANSFSCQDYSELDSVDHAFTLIQEPLTDWCFQLKYDGIWGKVVVENNMARVYSKTDQLKCSFAVPAWLFARKPIVLLAEYMYGSQWSQQDDRAGRLYVFDCLVFDGNDLSTLPYAQRKKQADALVVELGAPFYKVDTYNITRLGEVWGVLEQTMKYEGLIVRNLTSTYFTKLFKLKTEVEDDYVVMGFKPGEGKHDGRLGSLILAQYSVDNLTFVMDCGGGFSDELRQQIWDKQDYVVGKVCRVKGKSRFTSGALRHPQFVQFRDDKKPEDCKVKTP